MLKNIGSNWTLSALQILIFMVLSPFVVNTLGTEANGIWVVLVSLTNYLGLLILGVPMASVRHIAEHVANADTGRMNRVISTCLGMYLAMGLGALIVGSGLLWLFEHSYLASASWSHLDAATRAEAPLAFAIIVAQICCGFAFRLPYGIFDAHQDFVTKNLVIAGGLVLRLVLILWWLSVQASLVYLASAIFTVMTVEFLAALCVLRRRHPAVRFALAGFDRKLLRPILSFSIFAMVLNVGAKLAFQSDALVIGWFLTPADATFFDIGNKIFDPLTTLVLGIGMVVMPLATTLRVKQREGELGEIFLKWSKVAWSMILPVALFLLVLGPEFLRGWFGDAYDPLSGKVLQVLMGSFLLFLPVRGVALPILMGIDQPARPALALLAMGALNLVLSLALVRPLGLVGVALGTAIPNAFFAATVLVLACRALNIPVTNYLRHVVGRSLIGLVPPLFLVLACKHLWGVEHIYATLASGLAMTILYAAIWLLFVYRDDPHVDLMARLRRRAGGHK
ncbi:MAG: oligosaccharide flippase family protein [Planctomycetota bacterium]|jgi:O-antigen/teichoic acid export membrane protein|nr:oligosaccharide flippase family protein [Planctomycetota bacterium]